MHEQNRKVLEIIQALGFRFHSEFAAKMQVSEADLSRYVTGKRLPSKKFVEKLFDVFEVSPDWFYRDEGTMFASPNRNDIYASDDVEWLREQLLRSKDEVIRVSEELVQAKEEVNQLLKQMVEILDR